MEMEIRFSLQEWADETREAFIEELAGMTADYFKKQNPAFSERTSDETKKASAEV